MDLIRLLAKGKRATAQIAQNVGTALGETKEEIKQQGGLGTIVKGTTVELGRVVGNVVGTARDMCKKEVTSTPEVYGEKAAKGTDYVLTQAGKGTGYLVRGATSLLKQARTAVVQGATQLQEKMSEQVFDESERTVYVGSQPYVVNVKTVSELRAVELFMKSASSTLPPRLNGRVETLQFIAQKGIGDYAELEQHAKEAPEVVKPVLAYLMRD